jgi:hypothetical protein
MRMRIGAAPIVKIAFVCTPERSSQAIPVISIFFIQSSQIAVLDCPSGQEIKLHTQISGGN